MSDSQNSVIGRAVIEYIKRKGLVPKRGGGRGFNTPHHRILKGWLPTYTTPKGPMTAQHCKLTWIHELGGKPGAVYTLTYNERGNRVVKRWLYEVHNGSPREYRILH